MNSPHRLVVPILAATLGNPLRADEGSTPDPMNPFREVPEIAERSTTRNSESMRTTVVNGKRHIQITTNGQEIEIDDQNGKSIEIKITETDSKKETTYKAKDLADLKQQNAEIAELYERYTEFPPGGPSGFGFPGHFGGPVFPAPPRMAPPVAFPPGFGAPPAGFPGRNGPAPENAVDAYEQIEKTLDKIVEVQKALSAMKKDSFDEKQAKELAEKLDQAKKDLFAIQAQLGVR